jgi:ribosome-binding protein aMBF1 (putative translation factor)
MICSCSFCGFETEELKLVRKEGVDYLACYSCRQYFQPTAKAIQALEREKARLTEAANASQLPA